MEITFEKWKAEDYRAFYCASHNNDLYMNMNDSFPKTLDACRQAVRSFSISTDTTEYIRAIKVDNQIAGCIAAFFRSDMECKNAEIAYWLSPKYKNKGIMTWAVQSFTEILFSNFDLYGIYAKPFEENKASQKVLEKAGFRYEGLLKGSVYKNNKFIDSAVYALVKS